MPARSRWLAFGLAALVVLAIGTVVGLAAGGGDDSPVTVAGEVFVPVGGDTTDQQSTTTAASTTTVPQTTTSSTTSTTTTTTTTSTTTTTTLPPPNAVASFEGSVSASSRYSASYGAGLAIDGDFTTSWLSGSAATDGPVSWFRWTGSRDDFIAEIEILSNAEHAVPDFRTGFGYEVVDVQVLDATDNEVYFETVLLPGTPDPDVTVAPYVVGRSIVLWFSGREDDGTSGFAELVVRVVR